MGKIKRISTTLAALVLGLVILYLLVRVFAVLSHGYSWTDMDWNQDGSTSINEFFMASDIDMREVVQDGKKCIEYFAYKDGMPVKTVCSK